MESWNTSFRDWYRRWRRRQRYDEAEPFTNIELGTTCKDPKRIDSGISLGISNRFPSSETTPKLGPRPQNIDSIHLSIDFGDKTCIKSLDYGTFSRWSAIEGLMIEMENDGIFCEALWDASESMRVCKGDWDARVHPGWDIHVLCQQEPGILEMPCFEEDTDSDSEDPESEEDLWIDDVLNHYQDEWCLPRWREKVEPEKSMSEAMKEPSWTMLALGCTSIVLFFIAVVIYTS